MAARPLPLQARSLALLAACVALAAVLMGFTAGASAPRGGPIRWFSPASPLNRPIPEGAAVDRRSAEMVRALVADAQDKGFAIRAREWSPTVFYADASTPRHDVALTGEGRPASVLLDVPIPPGAVPDTSTDGHMAVIDRSSGCFYEFYAARSQPDGWTAGWANRGTMRGTGIQRGGYSTTASGFANLAGLLRPAELRAGVIDHALTFTTTYTRRGGVVRPATAGGGTGIASPGARTLPLGARVQLDPGLDLGSLGLTPWQRTVARALQVYGMYLVDTGSLGIGAVNARSFGANPYADLWGNGLFAYLPVSLAERLRVLALGRTYDANARAFLARSRCGAAR